VAGIGRNSRFIKPNSGANLPVIPVQTCHLTVTLSIRGEHMPQKRKSMKQIRKIIQLRLNNSSMSIRTIAQATNISRPVVKNYLALLAQHPVTAEQLDTLTDSELKKHLELETPAIHETEENVTLFRWLEKHSTDLNKVGMTRILLHEKYLEDHPEGLQYSHFCFVLKQRFQGPEASTLLDHKAGDKMYVDYTGNKFVWHDTKGNEYTEEVFLSVLGASSCLFALPVSSQKMKDFCYATEEAFLFYGGTSRAVVPDCLKSAVLSTDGHESVINPLYQRLMEHYQTICIPARPRHPKDKPLVEGAVNLIYRQIFARLGDRTFNTRTDMLRWWMQSLERINAAAFQKLPGTRRSRFEETDAPLLKKLPLERFDLSAILNQTVASTCSVYVAEDKTYYSVPSSLQGEKVEILVKPAEIEIWHNGERKAVHARHADAGKVIDPTHRSKAHQWYADRNPSELMRSLVVKGIHIGSWATNAAAGFSHEDLQWSLLEGLSKLSKSYPERLDTVCRIALKKEEYTLKALKSILKTGEDIAVETSEAETPEFSFHENVRGSSYYQESTVGV